MRNWLVPFMVSMLAVQACPELALAQSMSSDVSMDEGATISGSINVPGGNKMTSVSVSNENVRTVLRNLSQQAGCNLVMDDSVTGNVSLELSHVTVNQAIQSVAAMSNIRILRQEGNIFLAIGRTAADTKNISRQLSRVIHISYAGAQHVADVMNKTLFAPPMDATTGAAGGTGAAASTSTAATVGTPGRPWAQADARTNSVIVVGSDRDIQLAQSLANTLDVPRQNKTFYLSHARALDVAYILNNSIFADRSQNTPGAQPSAVAGTGIRVEKDNIQDSSDVSKFGSGGISASLTLRTTQRSSDSYAVRGDGAIVVPDTRQNAITILGTAEQIAQAESMIPTLDAQAPQVSIEASLIEITDTGLKELGTGLGIGDGRLQVGFNNAQLSTASTLVGLQTVDPTDANAFGRSGIGFSTNPVNRQSNYALQIRSLLTQSKAKILANPTIVATHDTESIISIADDVVSKVTVTLDASGFATQTIEKDKAGIMLDILPKIGEDGTVSMRLRPSVTAIKAITRDQLGNTITLLSRRDVMTQNVRIQDGETLIIGGLIQQEDGMRNDKLPGLGDMPIVGAMFRASTRNSKRSEIVLMITPHILNKTQLTPVNATSYVTPEKQSTTGGYQ